MKKNKPKKEQLIYKDNKISATAAKMLYSTKTGIKKIKTVNKYNEFKKGIYMKDLNKTEKIILLYYLTAVHQKNTLEFTYNPSEIIKVLQAPRTGNYYNEIDKAIRHLQEKPIRLVNITSGKTLVTSLLSYKIDNKTEKIEKIIIESKVANFYGKTFYTNYISSLYTLSYLYKLQPRVFDYFLILLDMGEKATKTPYRFSINELIMRKLGNEEKINEVTKGNKRTYMSRERSAIKKAIAEMETKKTHKIEKYSNDLLSISKV